MLSLMVVAIRKGMRGGAPGLLLAELIKFSQRFLADAKNPRREPDQVQRPKVEPQPAPEALQQPQETPRQALQGADLDAALAGLEQAPSRLEQHRQALAERERLQAEKDRERQLERQQRWESETSLEIAYDKKL